MKTFCSVFTVVLCGALISAIFITAGYLAKNGPDFFLEYSFVNRAERVETCWPAALIVSVICSCLSVLASGIMVLASIHNHPAK